MMTLGMHILLECDDVEPDLLASPERLEQAMRAAAADAGAHVLSASLHHFGQHQGVTGVLLLKESHLSIHTWPEFRYAAIDVFMCGDSSPESAIETLVDALEPGGVRHHAIKRGPTSGEPA